MSIQPHPTVKIKHASDILPQDILTLGNRQWSYAGHGKDDYYAFDYITPEGGEVIEAHQRCRVLALSELEALINAGFVTRMIPARVEIDKNESTYRSLRGIQP